MFVRNYSYPQAIVCPATEQLAAAGIEVSFIRGTDQTDTEQVKTLGEGYGHLPSKDVVTVRVQVRKRPRLMPVLAHASTDEEGNEGVEVLAPAAEQGDTVTYEWEIPINGPGKSGLPRWPSNRIHLLVEGIRGQYQLFVLGVFAQNFESWTWAELEDAGRVFRNPDGSVRVDSPSARWGRLIAGIYESSRRHRRRALLGAPASEPAPQLPPELAEGEGIVHFFNPFMGLGYAWVRQGEAVVSARVHCSKLVVGGPFGLRHLERGQIIRGNLKKITHNRGPQAGQPGWELESIMEVEGRTK